MGGAPGRRESELRSIWLDMWNDRIGRSALLVVGGLTAAYLLELGPELGRALLTVHLDRLALPLVLLLLAARTRRVGGLEERRFWRLVVLSLALWLAGSVLYYTSYSLELPRWVDLAVDVLYILLYLCLFYAGDQQPQMPDGWSRRDVLYPFTLVSATVFISIMFGYFVVVPWSMQPSENAQYFASFNLYVSIDTLLTLRFILLFRASRSRRWRRCFGLLAVATGALAVGDLMEGLYFAEIYVTEIGDRLDFIWLIPHLCLAAVGLTCTRPWSDEDDDPQDESGRVQSLLPMYAFVLPLIHFGMYLLGYLDPGARAPREAIVFSGLVIFAVLSLLQQMALERAVVSLRSDLVLRALDDRLRRSQRMESIGRLAGGIAHDFNNLLMVIRSYAELGRAQAASGDPRVGDRLREIDRATDRASGLVRQLLAFGRRQVVHPEVVDLNRLVGGVEDMLARILGDDVELGVELAPDAGYCRADPALIEQVIVNLAVNARDAMPRGGRLVIRTRAGVGRPSGGDRPAAGGRTVELVVSDTGVGIEPEIRDRIFEPYFTTKEMEKGTGLGLATVYGIVEQSGGQIEVDSEPGRGSTFTVRLPQVDAPVAIDAPPRVRSASSVAGATVLLTEDEQTIREALAEYLEDLGLIVLQACDGVDALRVAAEHDAGIDVLVTDLVMPRMSGPELARTLLGERPDLKVIYVSGYTPETMSEYGESSDGAIFLQKPFLLDELGATVREVLET